MKAMKRIGSVLLTLCLVFACASLAFADQTQRMPVCELYSADGWYEDDIGNSWEYSFHVPQINASSPDAEEINAEIAKQFGSRVEAHFGYMERKTSFSSAKTGWEAYWSGDQLFLLVSSELTGDYTDYAAYGYDFETGTRVTNAMILEQRGITEEEYLENLKEAVRLLFEDMEITIPEGVKTNLSREVLLEKTLNRLDMEQPMFINQFGEIETIVKIASVAGAGWYYYLATPFGYG